MRPSGDTDDEPSATFLMLRWHCAAEGAEGAAEGANFERRREDTSMVAVHAVWLVKIRVESEDDAYARLIVRSREDTIGASVGDLVVEGGARQLSETIETTWQQQPALSVEGWGKKAQVCR